MTAFVRVAGLVWVAAGIASAHPLQQKPVFRSESSKVRLEVSAFGAAGSIRGLKSSDFNVTDNNSPVAVSAQELEDLPLDIVLVVQPRRSQAGSQPEKFGAAVRSLLSGLDARDRVAVIVASAPPATARQFEPVSAPIVSTIPDGTDETALRDAMVMALQQMPASDRRKVILVVGDGSDRRSFVSNELVALMAMKSTAQVVVLGSAPTILTGVTFSLDAGSNRSSRPKEVMTPKTENLFPGKGLRDLATLSGGQIIDLIANDPAKVATQLMSRLRQGYMLTYEGTGARGWHAVTVKVTRPGITIATRSGYSIN
jgi:VWFA-related protein